MIDLGILDFNAIFYVLGTMIVPSPSINLICYRGSKVVNLGVLDCNATSSVQVERIDT